MAVPAEIMQMQGQGAGDQPPAGAPGQDEAAAAPAPSPSPAATPSPQEGNKVMAETNVQTAVTMLMNALPHYAVGSDEYNDLLDCLKKLSRRFGAQPASTLVPAQVQEMARQVQAGNPAATPPGATA